MATILVATMAATTTASAQPSAGRAAGRDGETVVVVPPVTLVDSTGENVRLDHLLDTSEPLALQFIFTSCPGVCPTLTATLAELGKKVPGARLISISIDPETDTPARLAEYKARFAGDERWHFLTGRSVDSMAAQQAFGSYRGEKMRHQPLTFLKPQGRETWIRLEGFATVSELAEALAGTRR